MNFHGDKWIMKNVEDHYNEALQHFLQNNVVAIALQGSQNYGLDTLNSDVDTKLVVTPTLDDLIMAKPPVSTTHVRENNEHIDFKDIRLLFQTLRKQNLNFVEIIFTPYYIVNPMYKDAWQMIIDNRELIAHYSPAGAVKTMKGIALEKFHALEHRYPAKVDIIDKWGYDGKQLSHLVRVEEFIQKFIAGEPYAKCLLTDQREYLVALKEQGYYGLAQARVEAQKHLDNVVSIADAFIDAHKNDPVNEDAENCLNEVQQKIMRASIVYELKGE